MSNKLRGKTILFDKLIGGPIFYILTLFKKNKPIKFDKKDIRNILLIRPGGIGDFLLNIPSFKLIKKEFPISKITILLFNRNKNCLEFYNEFNNTIIIDNIKNLIKFLLSNKEYDLCIDFDQHRKIPAILTILSKSKINIGFNNDNKKKAYNFPIKYKNYEYESQSFLNLLKPLNIYKNISENDLLLVKDKNKIKNSIGIYASAMKEDNRLSIKEWKKIIFRYGKYKKYYFFGSKQDKERYNNLESNLEEYHVRRMDGKLSLKESMQLISKMNILLSEDGGVYHLGVCTETPTKSYWLHGKDNMHKWKAPFKKHKGVLIR